MSWVVPIGVIAVMVAFNALYVAAEFATDGRPRAGGGGALRRDHPVQCGGRIERPAPQEPLPEPAPELTKGSQLVRPLDALRDDVEVECIGECGHRSHDRSIVTGRRRDRAGTSGRS